MTVFEQMQHLLEEIADEVAAPTTKWHRELLQTQGAETANLYVGEGANWKMQVAVLGDARMGTAVSTKRLTIMKLTDALARAAEQRAKEALA